MLLLHALFMPEPELTFTISSFTTYVMPIISSVNFSSLSSLFSAPSMVPSSVPVGTGGYPLATGVYPRGTGLYGGYTSNVLPSGYIQAQGVTVSGVGWSLPVSGMITTSFSYVGTEEEEQEIQDLQPEVDDDDDDDEWLLKGSFR